MFGALTPDVDQQILGAVQDAVGRGARVVLAWEQADPGSALDARVSEADGAVQVVVVSPHGRTL